MNDNLFRGVGIEVKIPSPENFLKIKETLTRMGIPSRKNNTLYQSCHILHKKDKVTDDSRYVILHFKELFLLDNKNNNFSEEDKGRRNTIVNLLEEWGLLSIVNHQQVQEPVLPLNKIKIIPYKERENWNLEAKYSIGRKL